MPKRKRLHRFISLSADTQQPNKVSVNDTLWHTIPDFSFTTQTGKSFTSEDAKDKVLIVSFFTAQDEERIVQINEYFRMFQEEFDDDKEVLLLAHTVTPLIDTLARLQKLVQQYKIESDKWFLLTGTKDDIYQQISEGYHLPIPKLTDSTRLETLVYPKQVVLVGRKGIIRGYYRLETLQDVKALMSDIRWLQLEYPTKHKREIEWKLKKNDEQ
ncbi:MAG: SCO family protein [Chitinophagales bacterium]